MFFSRLFFPVLAVTSIASVAFATPNTESAIVAGIQKRVDDPNDVLAALTQLNDQVKAVIQNPSPPATEGLPTNNGVDDIVARVADLISGTTKTLAIASTASPASGGLGTVVDELLGLVVNIVDGLLGDLGISSVTSVPASTPGLDRAFTSLLVIVGSKSPGSLHLITSKISSSTFTQIHEHQLLNVETLLLSQVPGL